MSRNNSKGRKVTLLFHVRRSSRKTQTFDKNSCTPASRSEVKSTVQFRSTSADHTQLKLQTSWMFRVKHKISDPSFACEWMLDWPYLSFLPVHYCCSKIISRSLSLDCCMRKLGKSKLLQYFHNCKTNITANCFLPLRPKKTTYGDIDPILLYTDKRK